MLIDAKKAEAMIASGKKLFVAGEESVLMALPRGKWIGGTIPYFMAERGGTINRDHVFITEVPAEVHAISIKTYKADELSALTADAPENGFTLLIIPALSDAHLNFAQDAPSYNNIFLRPTIGWIAGVHLDDLGKKKPKVIDGQTGELSADIAVAMHCELPADKNAEIGIINLFKPGSGDRILFPETGFSAKKAIVEGKTMDFAAYLREKNIDTRLPLVANYAGAMVNVSFQAVHDSSVNFYAPVFSGIEYRIAAPVNDYVKEFDAALPNALKPSFACNCILNFLYSELEGKKTAGMEGPVTFGEIAYQLLNQTLVYLTIV